MDRHPFIRGAAVASAAIADDQTLETELYDYATAGGQAELDTPKHDPRIPAL